MFSSILFMCFIYWLGHVSDSVFDCRRLLVLKSEELLAVHGKQRNLLNILRYIVKDWKMQGAQNDFLLHTQLLPTQEVNVCKMFFWLDSSFPFQVQSSSL